VQGDLNDMSFAERAVNEAENHFNRIDYMINPIGGWIGGKRLHDHSWDELEKMLSIDVKPTFNLLRAVLPVMVEQQFGKIINFSSMAAFGAGTNTAVYAASKAAVTQLTDSVAHEYGAENIQAFAIAPSTIDTVANRSAMPDADTSTWVSLEEIADAVLYLCTSGDSLSGTVLKFTGKII
jgi:NAD(P)-dependent dehydrogenase (short-subunit alcohol dehydrogenase family)